MNYNCIICKKEIHIKDLSFLLIKHLLCKECASLYSYTKKNVRIKENKIVIIIFKNYEYLKFYESNDNKIKVMNYYLEKYRKYNIYLFSIENIKTSLKKVNINSRRSTICLIQNIII